MKHRLLALIVAALAFVGCSTTQTQTKITPEKVGRIAKFAASASALEFLQRNPSSKDDLYKAKAILGSLVAEEHWDILALATAFQRAGFDKLNGQEGIIAVQGAVLAIDLSGHSIDLKENEYARAAIIGSYEGLQVVLRE